MSGWNSWAIRYSIAVWRACYTMRIPRPTRETCRGGGPAKGPENAPAGGVAGARTGFAGVYLDRGGGRSSLAVIYRELRDSHTQARGRGRGRHRPPRGAIGRRETARVAAARNAEAGMSEPKFRAGHVAIVGRPNVGK